MKETWTVRFQGVYHEGRMVPPHHALNPWFWRGVYVGERAAWVSRGCRPRRRLRRYGWLPIERALRGAGKEAPVNRDLDCRKVADWLAINLSEAEAEYHNEDEVFLHYDGSWDAVEATVRRLFDGVKESTEGGRTWLVIPCVDDESTYQLAVQPENDGAWVLYVVDSRPAAA